VSDDVAGTFVPTASTTSGDAGWSQTDPKSSFAVDAAAGQTVVTLPAGMVPDCSGVYDIVSAAVLFRATLAPVHVHMDAQVDVALHIEFDVPDIGRPGEVSLTLQTRAASFLPGFTSSLPISPKLSAATGANPAGFLATSLYTDATNHGIKDVSAGHHVWDLTIPMQMEQYQIGATFDLTLNFHWGKDTLTAIGAEQKITAKVTATVTKGAFPPVAAAADVFYRDPADQKFKPLTTLIARGFPCPPSGIDPATAKIVWENAPVVWGPATLLNPDPEGRANYPFNVAATLAPVAGGFKVSSTPTTIANDTPVKIPITNLAALLAHYPDDDRTVRLAVTIASPGTVPGAFLMLSNGVSSLGAAGLSAPTPAGTRTHSEMFSMSSVRALAGSDPYARLYIRRSATAGAAFEATITDVQLEIMSVEAP
jgi:hypothetical protein